HDCTRMRHGRRAARRYRTQIVAVTRGKRGARPDCLRPALASGPHVGCREAAIGTGSRYRLAELTVSLVRLLRRRGENGLSLYSVSSAMDRIELSAGKRVSTAS